MDREKGLIETESYEKYHISLAKVRKKYYTKEKLTKLEKALVMLVLEERGALAEVSKGKVELMEAKEKIEKLSVDLDMIGWYDEEEDRKQQNYPLMKLTKLKMRTCKRKVGR